jgi:succinoglycan biosynthesis transport protein ExoP
MDNVKKSQNTFDILRSILDHWLLVLIIVVFGSVMVVLYSIKSHRNYYTSSASLIFEPNMPELLYTDNERYLHSFEDWMRTQLHEIESNEVLLEAINSYEQQGFKWRYEGETEQTSIDRLRAKINVIQINNTQIMELGTTMPEREGLAELVNAVVDSYINFKDEQRKKQDRAKREYLQMERSEYEKRLDKSYKELLDISQKYATAVADEKNLYIYLNMFMDLKSRYNEVLLSRVELENDVIALREQKNQLSGYEFDDIVPESGENLADDIRKRMLGMRADSPEYQHLKELLEDLRRANIAETQQKTADQIEKALFEKSGQYLSAMGTEKQLKDELKHVQAEVMEFNTAIMRASTKRQEIDRYISIWNRINERIEQISIELFNPGRVRVLNAAKTPEFADENKMSKKIFLGVLGMIVAGLGLALGIGYTDRSIRRPGDVEKVLGFSATAHIVDSTEDGINSSEFDAVYRTRPDSYSSEQFRQISARIEKEHDKFQSRVYCIFSVKDGGGATSINMNTLAMLDAPADRKLFIDLNHRKPMTGRTEIPAVSGGVAECISDIAKLDSNILVDSGFPFHVLPLGAKEKLATGRVLPSELEKILDGVREKYDYIFVDAPPVLLASETQKYARLCDVSVMVADSKGVIWPELKRAVDLLNKAGVEVISVIINRIPVLYYGYYRKMMNEYYGRVKPRVRFSGKKAA